MSLPDPIAVEERRRRDRVRAARLRERRIAAGLCRWCPAVATVGHFCAPHKAALDASNANRRWHHGSYAGRLS